jgi:mono/diheme cytochrome c family protein
MRHVTVRRFALGLALLFVAAAAIFAWMVVPAPSDRAGQALEGPPPSPAALFEQRCGACHVAADLAPAVREGGADTRRRLEAFLEDHGDAPAPEDRLILDFLAAGRF